MLVKFSGESLCNPLTILRFSKPEAYRNETDRVDHESIKEKVRTLLAAYDNLLERCPDFDRDVEKELQAFNQFLDDAYHQHLITFPEALADSEHGPTLERSIENFNYDQKISTRQFLKLPDDLKFKWSVVARVRDALQELVDRPDSLPLDKTSRIYNHAVESFDHIYDIHRDFDSTLPETKNLLANMIGDEKQYENAYAYKPGAIREDFRETLSQKVNELFSSLERSGQDIALKDEKLVTLGDKLEFPGISNAELLDKGDNLFLYKDDLFELKNDLRDGYISLDKHQSHNSSARGN